MVSVSVACAYGISCFRGSMSISEMTMATVAAAPRETREILNILSAGVDLFNLDLFLYITSGAFSFIAIHRS